MAGSVRGGISRASPGLVVSLDVGSRCDQGNCRFTSIHRLLGLKPLKAPCGTYVLVQDPFQRASGSDWIRRFSLKGRRDPSKAALTSSDWLEAWATPPAELLPWPASLPFASFSSLSNHNPHPARFVIFATCPSDRWIRPPNQDLGRLAWAGPSPSGPMVPVH